MNELTAAMTAGEGDSLVDCIEAFALRHVRLLGEAGSAAGDGSRPPAPLPGYHDLMATARLRDLAKRRVAQMRREIFGSARVPFASLAEAVTWVEAQQTQAGDYSAEEKAAFLEAYRKLDAELWQLQYHVPAFELDHSHPRPRLLALRPGEQVRLYAVGKSGNLKALYYNLKMLADDLRVEDWEAAYFVLLGVPPAVPRYSVIYRDRLVFDAGEPPRQMVCVPWIELEINDRFFSYEDIREVYRDLATSGFVLSRKSAAQLAKLRRLEEFVTARRPRLSWREGALRRRLPWKRVLREWNAEHPDQTYCLSGIQKAYKEAGDYLEGRATAASRRRGRRREPGAGEDQSLRPAES